MYSRKIRVRPSDVSMDGRLKLRSLLDYFQNTAGLAVENIEGSTTELLSRGYAWVLARYEIDFFDRLPSLDEEFTLSTYHDPSHGYNTLRVFHVSKNDAEIVRAKSSWLLVDVKTGRAVKAASHLPEISNGDTSAITPEFAEIPEVPEIKSAKKIPVKWHDLDYNGHVNNAVYFGWIFDELEQDAVLRKISASFRSGAKLGEVITLESGIAGGAVIFSVIRDGVKKPSANFCVELEMVKPCQKS